MGLIQKIFGKKNKEKEVISKQSELEFLFEIYNCNDIETLNLRKPMVIDKRDICNESILNLNKVVDFNNCNHTMDIIKLAKENNHIKSNYIFDIVEVSEN